MTPDEARREIARQLAVLDARRDRELQDLRARVERARRMLEAVRSIIARLLLLRTGPK